MPTRRSLAPVIWLPLMAACLLILSGCGASPQACLDDSQAGVSGEGESRSESSAESEWPDSGAVEPDVPASPAGAAPERPSAVPNPSVVDLPDWPIPADRPESPAEGFGPPAEWPNRPEAPSEVGVTTSPRLPPVTIRPATTPPPVGDSGSPRAARVVPKLVPSGSVPASPVAPATTGEGPTSLDPQGSSGISEPIAKSVRPRSLDPSPLSSASPESTMPRASRSEVAAPAARSAEREPIAVRGDLGLSATTTEADAPSERAGEPPGTPDVAGASEAETDDAGYEVVQVFYGTDRKPDEAPSASEPSRSGYLGWLYLTATCAAASAVVMLAAARFHGRPTLLVFAGAGVAATVVLGVVTTLVRLQGEPVGPRPDRAYGNERGELELGICEVSIPAGHEVGAVERPSVFRLELQEDPRRHVVVLGIDEQPADEFFAGLADRVGASRKKEAFVFVHGFNTTFDEAAHRTAQLAYDLRFDGAPVFYSWPSQGGLIQYSIDETNADWTVPHLKDFLVAVARRSGAASVHLIAHSMGNRALTSALRRISYEMQDEQPLFDELVLTAPDIDAQVFEQDIVPAILPTAERVTLYASSNDEALKLSKTVHGYRRAGDSGSELMVIPGIDTIDVSTVDTSLVGHLYYGDNATVIADMLDLINQSKPPSLRPWLQARPFGDLMYWIFQRDAGRLEISQPPTPSIRR